MTPQQKYAALVKTFLGLPNVTQEGRGFGGSALRIDGKIFALLSSREEFVVKLPRGRVDELIASKAGRRFDPGHGRVMKEWLALRPTSSESWTALANEAMAFVGGQRTVRGTVRSADRRPPR
jgi:hypothetical protein